MPKIISAYRIDKHECIQINIEWPDEYADMINHVAGVTRELMQGHIADVFGLRMVVDEDTTE